MKNRALSLLLFFLIALLLMPSVAFADIGPKPSVVVDFKGLEGQRYYVTLLSETPSTGPHSSIAKYPDHPRYQPGDKDYEIWEKFVSYQDNDGYYFLQFFNDCSDSSQFTWGYYPPGKFKILLYFPQKDSFVVSAEIFERYAFDSYFAADASKLFIQPNSLACGGFQVAKSYDFTWEIISLLARVAATVIIEVFIALLFGFKTKKQLLFIAGVNILTQSVLNILLNIFNYKYGNFAYVLNYIWMELLVIAVEAVLYTMVLGQNSDRVAPQKCHPTLYAVTANAVSFGAGLFLSFRIPGIF